MGELEVAVQVAAVGRSPDDDVFVGRRGELSRLRALRDYGTPQVLFIHGLVGSGKSALVRQFAMPAWAGDPIVIALDCREVEPTERGFLAALDDAAGGFDDIDGDGVVLRRIARLGRLAERVVLCLDHYEVLRLLDTWLRQVLVPSLPDNLSLVLAGREEPNPAWSRLRTGDFEAMLLGPLRPEDSAELVRSMGVAAEDVVVITRFAGGHPLTLVLGALAAKERPAHPIREVAMSRLLDEFARAYLDDLGEETQSLLEAAAVVRRVSRPLRAAMLPDVDPWKGFSTLRALPIVEVTADGLALHEALQQTIATELRAAEPARHRTLRQRAWGYFREELRNVPRSDLWRHTADMIYLLENKAVREAHFPSGAHQFAIEPATPSDAAAINGIIDRHEPPAAAELLRSWWSRCPEAFRVARDRHGAVAGFSIITTSGRIDLRKFAYDPVVASWLEHLRQNPIPPSQELLLIRRWLTWEAGDGPCEAQASMWLDLKRTYMELRPHLRRNYGSTDHPEIYGPVMKQLNGGTIPGGVVEIDGREYHGLYLEFGPSSVDGWLTRIAAEELGLPEDDLLDVRQRQVLVDGRRVDLTPMEFEVMHYLRERNGDTVARHELLADIWGYEADVGSNVVDAVIHTLRKKLGGKASMIETVRGVGYRLC